MNPNDLEKGKEYLILATYNERDYDDDYVFQARPDTHRFFLDASTVKNYVSLPSEPPTLVGSQPKYDPRRLLKKGDRVQVKRRNGRCNGKDGEYLREAFCIVAEDEFPNELVRVYHNSSEYRLDPAYLALVTPVEELEPYKLIDSPNTYNIVRDSSMVMTIHKKSHPSPKEAAEAECARLNAEHRKEQK